MTGAPRVAVLVRRFPRLSETFVLNEFLELRREVVPVRLLALLDPLEPRTQPEAAALRTEVRYLRGQTWWPGVPRMLRTATAHPRGTPRALPRTLRRWSVGSWRRFGEALVLVDELDRDDAHLHVHWGNAPTEVALLASRVAGVLFSVSAHAKDLYTTPVPVLAERLGKAEFVVTCTAANARYLLDTVGLACGRVVLCRHRVRLDRFSSRERSPVPGRLFSVGRLVPKKGFSVLIEASAVLRERGVNFTLDIVGDGPGAAALGALVEQKGLRAHVRLLPACPQPELLGLYHRDGVPNVILEAMACGTPVALARGLEQLLLEPAGAEAMGRAAEASVRRSFELEACVATLTELFNERLGRVAVEACSR